MIDAYRFGRVSFGGRVYANDVIIHGDSVTSWWREQGHRVSKKDIEPLAGEGPAVIVIGTGAYGMMKVPDGVRAYLEDAGIEPIVKKTSDAVETFNRLLQEGTDVAIAMHLTC